VASGKSATAGFLSAQGAVAVDADRLAREVLSRAAVRQALVARFGSGILKPDGAVERSRLAAAAFGEGAAAVADLNAITHPPILALVEERIAAAGPDEVLVLDLPLLIETGLDRRCDLVIFVEVSEKTRRDRAAARGWSLEEHTRREACQTPLDDKRRGAGICINNDKGLDELEKNVRMLWQKEIRLLRSSGSKLPQS
jgi:dephospho-CoA kinase